MGLLQRINELGLNNTDNVTILADGDYVIFEEKNEKCLGMYKVYDTRGYEVLFRATELTKQDIISVSELKELAKGFVIEDWSTPAPTPSFNVCVNNCDDSTSDNPPGSDNPSIIVGPGNTVKGKHSIIIGTSNMVSGDYAISIGYYNMASNRGSTAIGYYSAAKGEYSTAIGPEITVIAKNVLGNGGPIYGTELYSAQLDISSTISTSKLLSDIHNLTIYNSTTEYYYTIDSNDSADNNYFDLSIVKFRSRAGAGNEEPINTVNITQLVYTLVGAVKELKQLADNQQITIDNQQTTIQDLASRLTTLEST